MDDVEFEALYRREYPGLVGQLTVLCRDPAEAADCVQEAFVKAWQHRRHLDLDRSPGGWVRTAAVRVAVSRNRRRATGVTAIRRWAARPTPAAPDPDPGDGVAALLHLPLDQRQALGLHYLLDMPVAEVARLLDVPEGTVKARLHRGRQALAARLATAAGTDAGTGGVPTPAGAPVDVKGSHP